MKSFKRFLNSVNEDLKSASAIGQVKGMTPEGEKQFAASFNRNANQVTRAGLALLQALRQFRDTVSRDVRRAGPEDSPDQHFYHLSHSYDERGRHIGTNIIRDQEQVEGLIRRYQRRL
jgi:hypothetical protein